MAIQLKADVKTDAFNRAVNAYLKETTLDIQKVMMRGFSGVARRLIGITPPAYGERGRGGTLTKDDQRRGENAIDRDLAALFWPAKIQRKKGKPLEEFPDVVGIHKKIFGSQKRPGKDLRNPRGVGEQMHVDYRKLNALRKSLYARVGAIAAGWLNGAEKVKATGVPAWVKRHTGNRGTSRLVIDKYGAGFEITNTAVPSKMRSHMERLKGYAVNYEAKAMFAAVKDIMNKPKKLKG